MGLGVAQPNQQEKEAFLVDARRFELGQLHGSSVMDGITTDVKFSSRAERFRGRRACLETVESRNLLLSENHGQTAAEESLRHRSVERCTRGEPIDWLPAGLVEAAVVPETGSSRGSA